MLNGAKLRELYYRILAGAEDDSSQADMMYLVGETRSNQKSCLDKVREFNGPIGIIGYTDTEWLGYPGANVWIPELKERGVTDERIVLIEGSFVQMPGSDRKIIHTLSEMCALVRYAKGNGIHKLIMVAPRFHLLRAFMSGVLALVKENYPDLRLYPMLGAPLDWNGQSSHSQGTLTGIRADFLVEETIRIFMYHAQGNLPDPETVLDYLDYHKIA